MCNALTLLRSGFDIDELFMKRTHFTTTLSRWFFDIRGRHEAREPLDGRNHTFRWCSRVREIGQPQFWLSWIETHIYDLAGRGNIVRIADRMTQQNADQFFISTRR